MNVKTPLAAFPGLLPRPAGLPVPAHCPCQADGEAVSLRRCSGCPAGASMEGRR